MAQWKTINVNEYGWAAELELVHDGVPQNISSYTTLEYEFKPPRGDLRVRPAVFLTNGSDGILRRIIEAGDINSVGGWSVRAHIARTSPPADLRTSWHRFWVEK